MARQLQEGRRWNTLRNHFKAQCQARRDVCIHCSQPIEYTAPAGAASAFEADHRYPASTHPHLAYVESNLMPSHSSCNRSRGTKAYQPAPSEWVTPDW